jgi:hypothetical protein
MQKPAAVKAAAEAALSAYLRTLADHLADVPMGSA